MGQNAIYYKGKSYSGGGGGEGSEVIPNPEDAATDVLTKLSVDGDVYGIPEINVEDVYVNGTSALDENNIAQIKSYQEITKAEYDALPSSKLTDDILYCITDGGATEPGEYFNPVIYSTTEREVGVWTDGKPLYQKTFLTTSPSDNISTNIIEVTNLNIDVCGKCAGVIYNALNQTHEGGGRFVLWMRENFQSSGKDYIACTVSNSSYYSNTMLVTIQYTKTTDTPGSGKYTTLGVPSTHYSTDEQVVGTWIDGKPLYQKTIHTSGISMKLNGIYDFTSLFPLTNTVRDITVIGNYLDNDSPNYFSLGVYCVYFNPSEAPAHTLRLNMGSSTQTFEFFITIKYTKTTD